MSKGRKPLWPPLPSTRIRPDQVEHRIFGYMAWAERPLEIQELRQGRGLESIPATDLRQALEGLMHCGLVEEIEKTGIILRDGIRIRRDYLVYQLTRRAAHLADGGGRES
jgi:hypothetical protein